MTATKAVPDRYPRMRQGTCYPASALMARLYPELDYAEGVLTFSLAGRTASLSHAWNVDEDGAIVDATLTEALRADDVRLLYTEVRRGTALTIEELNDRGNPPDLEELARVLARSHRGRRC